MRKKLRRKRNQNNFLRPTLGKILLTILFLVIVVLGFSCWMMDATLPLHCFVSVPLGLPFYVTLYSLVWVGGDGLGFFLGWLLSIFFYYVLASCVVLLWKKVRGRREK